MNIFMAPMPIPFPTTTKDWAILVTGGPLVLLTVKSVEKLLAMREDPKLRELSEKLRRSNELYQAARKVAESQKNEIKALHREIEELVKSKDREKIDRLVARLEALIGQMRKEAA